jgi:DNA-binding beta-propeller fold protein YncE
VPAVAFLALAARANYEDYFETHIGKMQAAGINTTLARYVDHVNDRYQVWVLGPISLRYDTEHFLIPDVDGVDAGDVDPVLPLDRIPAAKGVAFLVAMSEPNAQQRLDRIKKVYPGGKTIVLKTPIDIPVFHVHLVENADLVAANPTAMRDPRPIPALRLAELQRRAQSVARGAPVAAPLAVSPEVARRAASLSTAPWLSLPQLREPLDLAVTSGGDIYVSDRITRQVLHLDANGGLRSSITTAGTQPLEDPRAVAVGRDDALYILDSQPTRVHVFDAAGNFLRTTQLPGGYYPNGISIDENGAMLIADTGQSRAVKVTADGRVTVIGKNGLQKTVLDQPTDIALAKDGEIFVADGARSRVVVFGPDFAYRREWEIPTAPVFPGQHLLITDGRVLVSQPEQGVILAYDAEGKLQSEWGRERLRQPVGMALDGAGDLLVADVTAGGLFKLPLAEANAPAADSDAQGVAR